MKLDIKKIFTTRTDRVKALDFHPTEPWVLSTLYSGKIEIWNYESQTLVKSLDVTNVPVRAGKFIARKNWIILGADDFQVRIYNYNTSEKLHQFEAHPDYVRCIDVHPTRPYVITSSDDMTIRLWNWEQNWKLEQVFEGHQHYIMGLKFNPKDPNTFASGCLDRTVKIWSLGSPTPNFTLEAHVTKGVNYVDYYPLNDKPYLITCSDDRTIKIWDYQTKSCVATLEGHLSNVSFAIFHPELPLIISGSEDGSIKIWNANTYKLEGSVNFGLERAWSVASKKGSNLVAFGFDAGHMVVKLGKEEPSISMDPTGKIIWSKNSEVFTTVIKNNSSQDIVDGEIIPLQTKELGTVEIYPTKLQHSPNGRFVAVSGDGEYIIYTALAWRNKAYGSALDFVWGQDSNDYAIREAKSQSVKLFKNFKQRTNVSIDLDYKPDKLFGGALLGVESSTTYDSSFIHFFDWETGRLVSEVDVSNVTDIVWTSNGELVVIICSDISYVLRYDSEAFHAALNEESEALSSGGESPFDPQKGIDNAFEVIEELNEQITSGKWIGDVFLYTTATNRLNYFVGDSVFNVHNFDNSMYLLDYLPRDNRVYLCDKDVNIISIGLSLTVLEYQTTVLRSGVEDAREFLESIPSSDMIKISKFLQDQGFLEESLSVSTDDEQKFELAMKLNNFTLALEIAHSLNNQMKWNKLGDALLKKFKYKSAIQCFEKSQDHETLFLLYSSFNNLKKLTELGLKAKELGKNNLAFNCFWLTGNKKEIIKLLEKTGRLSEASIFGFKYGLSYEELEKIVKVWQTGLLKEGKVRVAEKLQIPNVNNDAFPAETGVLIDVDESPVDAALPADTALPVDAVPVEAEAEVEV
ncbi:coatomer subunit beta' [Saccharomycopsis crataegensis]|uniref:Coatomer subunit beta' n=1 Tax=Saccharomycopsis crataegensis TaxID=43959 RepID=A0AAV5QET5_9ASCO|nr:coatomer subunit beta' [Saccharomycopsis crataegensis]